MVSVAGSTSASRSIAFPFPLAGVILAGVSLVGVGLAGVGLAGIGLAGVVFTGVVLVRVALVGIVLVPFFGGVGLARTLASLLESLILRYFRGRLAYLSRSWRSSYLVLEELRVLALV